MLKKLIGSLVIMSFLLSLSVSANADCGNTYQRASNMARAKVAGGVVSAGLVSFYGSYSIALVGATEAAFMIGLAAGSTAGYNIATKFYRKIDPREMTSMNRILRELRANEYGASQVEQLVHDIELVTGVRPNRGDVTSLIRNYNQDKVLCPKDDVIMPYSGLVKKLTKDLAL